MKSSAIINSLTSLRFIAALGVFFHHTYGFLSPSILTPIQNFIKYFFYGHIGVTFFYVLSGFIISYSFVRHQKNGIFGYSDFLVFRVSRLFPVHILSMILFIVCFGVYLTPETIHLPSFFSNLFLIHAFIPEQVYYFSFNSVSWSISSELFFYVAFCFLVRLKTKYLLMLFLSILSVVVYTLISPPESVPAHWLFYINPIFRLPDFIAGMLLCRFFLSTSFTPNYFLGSLIEIGSIVLLAITLFVASNFVSDMNLKFDIMFIPAMIAIVMAFSYNAGVLSKLLSNRIAILLGEASFSFYMIHGIVISKLLALTAPSPDSYKSVFLTIGTALCISTFVSILIYKKFELPLNRAIRRSWEKFRAHRTAAVYDKKSS